MKIHWQVAFNAPRMTVGAWDGQTGECLCAMNLHHESEYWHWLSRDAQRWPDRGARL